jgi:hypothetical protein
VAGVLALVAAIAANLWLARRRQRPAARSLSGGGRAARLARGYAVWSFIGAVLVFCAAPTTIMMWRVLALFHAAVLPVVFWLEHLLAGRPVPSRRSARSSRQRSAR